MSAVDMNYNIFGSREEPSPKMLAKIMRKAAGDAICIMNGRKG